MKQLRILFGAVLVSAALAVGLLATRGNDSQPASSAHVQDRRCRGGCVGTPNVLTHTQAFDNAVWTKIGSTTAPVVTADAAVAPDGTTTADQVVFPAVGAGAYSLLRQVVTLTGPGTFSLYVRGAASSGSLYLGPSANGAVYISCAYTSTAWTRCSGSATLTSGDDVDIGWNVLGGSGTGAGATVYIWGAQLQSGSLGPYRAVP